MANYVGWVRTGNLVFIAGQGPIQVAVARRLQLGEDVQGTETRRRLALLDGQVRAQLAQMNRFGIDDSLGR